MSYFVNIHVLINKLIVIASLPLNNYHIIFVIHYLINIFNHFLWSTLYIYTIYMQYSKISNSSSSIEKSNINNEKNNDKIVKYFSKLIAKLN